jgi:hypothetical protein
MPPPAAWFAFSPDRSGEYPQGHLKSFRRTLQADASAGLHPLYEGCRILEAACWAHTRSKFHDILAATQSPTASEAIRRIGELYAIEKEVRGSPPEIRLAIRQVRARPVMEALRPWFDATLQTLSAKSDMAGAIRYAISRWTALTRYLDDGEVEIDNNAAERALRVVDDHAQWPADLLDRGPFCAGSVLLCGDLAGNNRGDLLRQKSYLVGGCHD